MLYWWSRIKDLSIPQPKTIIVPVHTLDLLGFVDSGIPLRGVESKLKAVGVEIGYPLFLRTDVLSNKHDWENSCYVKQEQDLLDHIRALAYMNFAVFAPAPSALVFREYIPLASQFTAFWGNLPIAPERRYFVRDGVVQCHHPYWPVDTIQNPSVPNWAELLAGMNRQSAMEVLFLTGYAQCAGKALGGYWSVDFALARGNKWFLIDCAEGEKSYHWEGCRHAGIG